MSDDYVDFRTDGSNASKAKKGIYLSKTSIILYTCVVVVLLVAEGLIIGLVGRPDCDVVRIAETTQAPPKPVDSTAAPVMTTAGPTGVWANIRLPLDLIPESYVVDLRPILEADADGKYWFFGSSSVRYRCENPTKHVVIHTTKLEFTEDDVSLTSGGSNVDVANTMFYEPNQYFVVETAENCVKGQMYTLAFNNFKGELADDLDGLYRSEYDKSTGEHVVMATTQMQATGARKTFPCFDEPALKAKFAITLWFREDQGYFAISNMPVESSKTDTFDGATWTAYVFEESVPMSTYLLAMVVSDFGSVQNHTTAGVQTRIYGRQEPIDAGEAEYAAIITPQILDFFVDYFNVSYPLPKSDQIGVPDFGAGAMENWGLVIYREVYVLYNEKTSTINYKIRITNIISHELAHQVYYFTYASLECRIGPLV